MEDSERMGQVQTFSCKKCPMSFDARAKLEKHRIESHNNFQCNLCGKVLSRVRKTIAFIKNFLIVILEEISKISLNFRPPDKFKFFHVFQALYVFLNCIQLYRKLREI